jgi:hypothetical protein
MKKQLLIASLLAIASAAMAQTAPTSVTAPAAKPGVAATPAAGVRQVPVGDMGAKRQVERFDTNKDGKVSLKEFLAPGTENFRKIDLNNDNNITVEELSQVQKRHMAEFEKRRAADVGKQGQPVTPVKPAPAPATAPAK